MRNPNHVVGASAQMGASDREGEGVRIEADELDLLNAFGLGVLLMEKAAAEQKAISIERQAAHHAG